MKAVKYSQIFTNIKTGKKYWLLFLIYFLEQQIPSNCTTPIIVYYCLVMKNACKQ